MSQGILDEVIWDNEELMQLLRQNGYPKLYEVQQGHIIVEESAQVKVRIHTKESLHIKPVFPDIGNGVQILSTILLIFILGYLEVPFGFLIAIACGQIIAYAYYRPKALQLKKALEILIANQYREKPRR